MVSVWAGEVHAQTTTEVGRDGVHYSSDQDCSRDPSLEKCREQTKADAGEGGLGFSARRTEVVRTDPSSGYFMGLIEANGVYGSGSGGLTIAGGGVGFGARVAAGETFPDENGGGWNGFGADLSFRYSFTTFEASGFSSTSHQLDLGGTFGYQYLNFGPMDPVSFEQSGFGFFLGYHAGFLALLGDYESTAFSHGPGLTLSLPKYNPGTAQVSQLYLTALVLPLEDFFLATVSVGYSGSEAKPKQDSSLPRGNESPSVCRSANDCGPGELCSGGRCVPPQSEIPPAELPGVDF